MQKATLQAQSNRRRAIIPSAAARNRPLKLAETGLASRTCLYCRITNFIARASSRTASGVSGCKCGGVSPPLEGRKYSFPISRAHIAPSHSTGDAIFFRVPSAGKDRSFCILTTFSFIPISNRSGKPSRRAERHCRSFPRRENSARPPSRSARYSRASHFVPPNM